MHRFAERDDALYENSRGLFFHYGLNRFSQPGPVRWPLRMRLEPGGDSGRRRFPIRLMTVASNQICRGIPMFDARGFQIDAFSVVGATNSLFSPGGQTPKRRRQGHEIASHTLSHPNLAELPDSQQTTELKDSRLPSMRHVSGQKCLHPGLSYWREANEALTSQYYIAARTCSGRIVPATPRIS